MTLVFPHMCMDVRRRQGSDRLLTVSPSSSRLAALSSLFALDLSSSLSLEDELFFLFATPHAKPVFQLSVNHRGSYCTLQEVAQAQDGDEVLRTLQRELLPLFPSLHPSQAEKALLKTRTVPVFSFFLLQKPRSGEPDSPAFLLWLSEQVLGAGRGGGEGSRRRREEQLGIFRDPSDRRYIKQPSDRLEGQKRARRDLVGCLEDRNPLSLSSHGESARKRQRTSSAPLRRTSLFSRQQALFDGLCAKPARKGFAVRGQACARVGRDLLRSASLRVLGQFDKRLVLAALSFHPREERPSLLLAIDQHAMDERVQLERLKNGCLASGEQETPLRTERRPRPVLLDSLVTCCLLPSPSLSLAEGEEWGKRVERKVSVLESWGFSLQPTEQGWVLLSTPRFLGKPLELLPFLEDDHVMRWPGTEATRRFYHWPKPVLDLLASKACKSAVTFNTSLSVDEMRSMVAKWLLCEDPTVCAHGRPSVCVFAESGESLGKGKNN